MKKLNCFLGFTDEIVSGCYSVNEMVHCMFEFTGVCIELLVLWDNEVSERFYWQTLSTCLPVCGSLQL